MCLLAEEWLYERLAEMEPDRESMAEECPGLWDALETLHDELADCGRETAERLARRGEP
jgi:hypothetical protein